MRLTSAPGTFPELSCYTTNLLAYLEPEMPDVRCRLADAIRIAVREDVPPDALEFSHHTRIDITPDGRELAYQGARDWEETTAVLIELLGRGERVLAVGNSRNLPWSPSYGRSSAPHWILVREHHAGRWLVADHFTALTPDGEQRPFLGWLTDGDLAMALAPDPRPSPETINRDRFALGPAMRLPPRDHYRWVARVAQPSPGLPDPGPGSWRLDRREALMGIAAVLVENPDGPGRYAEDLWAAGRHQSFRLASLAARGKADPEGAAELATTWRELPRALRFAAQSAARGRPRAGVVRKAFERLLAAEESLFIGPHSEE